MSNDELSIPVVEKQYDKLFESISHLNQDEIIIQPNCKFCNHPMRMEAEMAFERSLHKVSSVAKFFREYEKEHPNAPRMNDVNIRNHLSNHYLQQEKRLYLQEYSSRLKEVLNYKMDTDRRFEVLTATLELKLHQIAADPNLDPCKQADTMSKLVKSLLEINVTQAKLRGEMSTTNLVIEKFTNTWIHMAKEANDPHVKKSLLDGLESFQSQLEGTVIPDVD